MYEELFPRMVEKNTVRHADTLWVMSSLGSILDAAGEKERALKLRMEAARISEEFLGPEHYDTLGSKARLACSCSDAGRRDEAIWLREQILPLLNRVRGPAHSDTVWVRGDLLVNYQEAGRRKDVIKLRREMLGVSVEKDGPDAVRTLKAKQNLALDLSTSGEHTAAVTLQEETLKSARSLPVSPANATFVRSAVENMARCYEAAGRSDAAVPLREELGTVQPGLTPPRAVIIPADATWKWLHPSDGKDPAAGTPGFHETFFLPGFDDAAWNAGAMQGDGFGYGEGFAGVDIGTPVPAHRHTAYFRHRFRTDKPLTQLEIRAQRDDGVIIYFDGKPVCRDNMKEGPEAWLLAAGEPVSDADEGVTLAWPVPGELPAGDHVLAISVHNVSGSSSDLRLGGVSLVVLEGK